MSQRLLNATALRRLSSLRNSSSALTAVRVAQQRRQYEGGVNQKYDPTRKQPFFESPYEGPNVNENTSGLPYDADLWWGDHKQQEHIIDEHPDWIPRSQLVLELFYFLGWAFAAYGFYKYFIASGKTMHPMATVVMTEAQIDEGMALRAQRLADMETYGIDADGNRKKDE